MEEQSVPFNLKKEALKMVEKQAKEIELYDKVMGRMQEEISQLVELLREIRLLDVLEADMTDEVDALLAEYIRPEKW